MNANIAMEVPFQILLSSSVDMLKIRNCSSSLPVSLWHYRERVLNATSGSLQELNVQGLQPGSAYEFRVVALNQHGIGESSLPLRVSTITLQPGSKSNF